MRILKTAVSIGAVSFVGLAIGLAVTGPAIGQGHGAVPSSQAAKADKSQTLETSQTAKADKSQISQTAEGGQPVSAPIKGFHPIKRALQPVENLEGLGIKLEQQIMKLEGPIAALQPPMVSLRDKMTVVDASMLKMEKQVCGVNGQMGGVRSDLAKMQADIAELKKPILSIQQPLAGIAKPLEEVKRQLNLVVLAIFAMAIGIVFGTPLAAIVTYRFRHKLFPQKIASAIPGDRVLAASPTK
jgi:hypothetical protein